MKAQGYQTVTRSRAGKDGNPGVSAFKSVVFKRSNEDIDTPVGGAYNSPVPSGWSDGVPGGEEKLWMSTRIFTNTGGAPQQDAWTTPSVVTDTTDIDFEFSAAASNPGNPTSSPKLWHNTATSDDVWMAVRKKSNGVWGDWEVSKIKGEQGEPGQDGKTLYTWIRYADDAQGGGISADPVVNGELKKYIGFAYNKETSTASDEPTDYSWALFKGTDGKNGVPGEPGMDGTTYYTWIKYADSLGENGYPAAMYDTPTTATGYIGIAVNKTTQTEGTDTHDYTWSRFKGEDGKGIASIVDYYAVSASKTTPPVDWTPNTPPDMAATLRYLWKYTLTTYTDGLSETTTPCVIGMFGVDGLSYRYSQWTEGVEYRNDNNPYFRDSNGQGIIDVVYKDSITMYDPNSNTTPPAGYICRKTHTSGDTVTFSSEGNWTQEDNVFTSDTITANNATWAKIKFKTTSANTKITVKITASSEANYDWGYVCGLDADFSTTSYLAKVSGTNTQTIEIAVPEPGEHFFYIGYTKNVSGDKNNDNTVVEIISISPSPVPLAVGEYWTQMNSMAPILTALVLADRIKANAIDVETLAANATFIDSLTVNKLIAGTRNGQRIEIMPDKRSLDIYDLRGTLVSTFEGNTYSNISSLFGDNSGSLPVTTASERDTASASMNGARQVKVIDTMVTEAKQLTSLTHITVGAGKLDINAIVPNTFSDIEQSFSAIIQLRVYVYSDSACANLRYSETIYTANLSGSKSDGGTSSRSLTANLAGRIFLVNKGWVRIGVYASFYAEGISCSCTCSWSGLSAITYSQDFYVSRYFANGLCLGIRNSNYVAIYNQAIGGMRMLMENEGYGFDFSQNGIKFRRNSTESWKSLIPKYGLPFAVLAVGTMNLNSKSPSIGPYKMVKTSSTDKITVSYKSDGTFTVTVPSAWGSSYLVQLTTLGRTTSGNPVGASVYSRTTGSFVVDTMSLKGTWVNEVKVMFLITRLEDFDE